MTTSNRRTHLLETGIIENALLMAKRYGMADAITYMLESGIPECLAYRVLSDPKFHRHGGERRVASRCALNCEGCADSDPTPAAE